ncbi:hypothetical protein [Eisenbergiella sp.]
MDKERRTEGWPYQLGQILFYIGLVLELLIVIVDKSAYINPWEGQLFRITFLLFLGKICLTRYSFREWLWMLFFLIIAGTCYLFSGRDEAVRLVVFCASFKNVDLRKSLQLAFFVTLSGCLLLILLALTGIFGQMYIVDAGDRGIRYTFGLGHPNAFFCMFWVLVTLGIYLYWRKMKLWMYGLLLAAGLILFLPTDSRTGVLILVFTLAFSLLFTFDRKARDSKWLYIAGILLFFACVGLSIWIACYEPYEGPFYPYDRFFTGRITSMNTLEGGGGILRNWRLFSRPENIKYFDMGYVRLFYWYGIIPGALYVLLYAMLMWQCYKKKNYMGFMMVLSFALYTMLEAHFISVYLGRNYALFLLGAYWSDMLCFRKPPAEGMQDIQEEYWWQGWRFLSRKETSGEPGC